MDIKILIALIAAITSLIVSIINIILKDRNKHKYDRVMFAKLEKGRIIDKKIEAMDGMSIQIQKVKDTLQLFYSALDETISIASAHKILSDLRNETSVTFENCQINLEGISYRSSHSAKNLIFDIENFFINSLKGKKYVNEMEEKKKNRIREY